MYQKRTIAVAETNKYPIRVIDIALTINNILFRHAVGFLVCSLRLYTEK